MNDQDNAGRVRRFGAKDRKQKIDAGGSLFPLKPPPPPDLLPEEQPAPPTTPPLRTPGNLPPEPPLPPVEDPGEGLDLVPFADFDEAERFPPLKPAAAVSAAAPPRRRSFAWQNLVAILFLLATIGVVVVGVAIFRDPFTELNPFPPFTPLPIIVTATPPPTLTPTLRPTRTPAPTATFTPLPPEALGLAPESTAESPTAEVTEAP